MSLKIVTRKRRDYNSNWVQTVTSIIALAFSILGGFGLLTPEQTTEATPLVGTTLGAIGTAIAGVVAIIGILFKSKPTV